MKKITVMSIILAILLMITTVVCAANTSTTAKVTAPGEVTVPAKGEEKTVDVTVKFANPVALGEFQVKCGTEGVLEYVKSDIPGVVQRGENYVFALGTETISTIKLTFRVVGEAGKSTTVEFIPVEGTFGESSDDVKAITVEGKPTIRLVSAQEPPVNETPETNTTPAPETNTTPEPETNTTPAPETNTTPAPETNTTPAPETNTVAGGDLDSYDQTGISVAVVGAIALVVIVGTAVVVKRK